MKVKCFLFILFLFVTTSQSQNNSNKSLIVFKTYEDFVSNSGLNLGKISDYSYDNWGGNKIFVIKEDVEEKIYINQYWGFRIDDNIFRMNKDGIRMPLLVLKKNEKVYYVDGYVYFDKIAFGRNGFSKIQSDGFFYSDNLNSEVFEITKIIKQERDNPKLKDLIECIKKAKKRIGYQSEFNGFSKCLKD